MLLAMMTEITNIELHFLLLKRNWTLLPHAGLHEKNHAFMFSVFAICVVTAAASVNTDVCQHFFQLFKTAERETSKKHN